MKHSGKVEVKYECPCGYESVEHYTEQVYSDSLTDGPMLSDYLYGELQHSHNHLSWDLEITDAVVKTADRWLIEGHFNE